MNRLLLAAALAVAWATTASADYIDGRVAYDQGNYAAAVREWLPLAQEGDARARYSLAILFLYGRGLERDPVAAAALLSQAARQGLADAQYALGALYHDGLGVVRDEREAARLYRQAAIQDHAGAQNNLGILHATGQGVAYDPVAAHMWFNLAALHGAPAAAGNRARTAEDLSPQQAFEAEQHAFVWVDADAEGRAALAGVTDVLAVPPPAPPASGLAAVNREAASLAAEAGGLAGGVAAPEAGGPEPGSVADYARQAGEWLPRAQAGDPEAQYGLGVLLLYGRGVERNRVAAASMFKLAAEREYTEALYALGVLYNDGVGVVRNLAEAAAYYHRAALRDHGGAQNNLGILYAAGVGVPYDPVLAHMWFNLAGGHGATSAAANRDRLAASLTPAQLADSNARVGEWLRSDAGTRAPVPVLGGAVPALTPVDSGGAVAPPPTDPEPEAQDDTPQPDTAAEPEPGTGDGSGEAGDPGEEPPPPPEEPPVLLIPVP